MWKTPVVFALLGWVFSSRKFILFLNTLSPIQGLIFYYFQLFVTLEILQYFGLVVGGIKMTSFTQTIGELLLVFSFFILVDNESEWIQIVVKDDTKKEQNCPKVYLQAEDGATFSFWKQFTDNHETLRILTFVVTPIVLSTIGLVLTSGKPIQRYLLA